MICFTKYYLLLMILSTTDNFYDKTKNFLHSYTDDNCLNTEYKLWMKWKNLFFEALLYVVLQSSQCIHRFCRHLNTVPVLSKEWNTFSIQFCSHFMPNRVCIASNIWVVTKDTNFGIVSLSYEWIAIFKTFCFPKILSRLP